MTKNTSKVQKFALSLMDGNVFTMKQILARFKFAGRNSASGRITELRDRGMDIALFTSAGKPSKYALVSKEVVRSLENSGYKLAASY